MPGSAQLTLLLRANYWREPVKLIKLVWSVVRIGLVSSAQLINNWGSTSSIRQIINQSPVKSSRVEPSLVQGGQVLKVKVKVKVKIKLNVRLAV